MRDLLDKTESFRDESVKLQEKMSRERTILQKKQEGFDLISRQINEAKGTEKEHLLEEKRKLSLEIDELEENIEELEAQYGVVLEELNIATLAIGKVEEEIILMKSTEGRMKSHKKESSFTMDSDTKLFITSRKEEISREIPELRQKKHQLSKEIEELINTQNDLLLEVRDLEREILEATRQASECEDFLQRSNTPSPLRSRAATKLMWESIKGLWQLLTDNPWEYESDDIPKGIIRWAEHMKEHITRHKIDHDNYLQLLAQQRIDQASISLLNSKIQGFSEQLISKGKGNDELERLNAKLDAYKDKEKRWAFERNELIEKIRAAESLRASEELNSENSALETLRQEEANVRSNIRSLNEKEELQKKELEARLSKLKSYCDSKAEELYNLNLQFESKEKLLETIKEELTGIQQLKEELIQNIDNLARTKNSLDVEVKDLKASVKNMKPLKSIEEENDKAADVLKKITKALGLDFNESSDLRTTMRSLEDVYSKLKVDLEKAEKFKVNKQKFIEMYESNTKELQEEWSNLKKAKEEFEVEKSHIDSVKSDKRHLDDQMKQLVAATKEIQRVKGNLEKEALKLEEHLNSLRQSVSTFEALKAKELSEYNRIQVLHESELKKLEDSLHELKVLKAETKEIKSEKLEAEAALGSAKSQLLRTEDRRKSMEEEIRASETLLHKLSNKLTDDQLKVAKDSERIRCQLEEKQQEILNFENLIRSYESQILKLQEQSSAASNTLDSLNYQIEDKENQIREKKSALRELDSKILSGEASLDRCKKEAELLTQTFMSKKQKISGLDLEINEKSAELDRITLRHEQGASEIQSIEKQIARIKCDLQGVELVINQKNKEYEAVSASLRSKSMEFHDIERLLLEKSSGVKRAEEQLRDIHVQAKTEEEAVEIFRDEAKLLQQKISKLTEALKRVESQKVAVLREIDEINRRVASEEIRHKGEIESLRNAVSNGESTLRQLMESVQRCRNKLSSDKEESVRVTEEIHKLLAEKENLEAQNRDLANDNLRYKDDLARLKIEEDTALVLLALSGHKIDDKIKQRITQLCRAAVELEQIKSQMHDSHSARENRESISETRMRQNSRLESYENTSIYERENKTPQESRLEEFNQDSAYVKVQPEMSELQKLLHTLEVTQQRLRSMTPKSDLSFEQ